MSERSFQSIVLNYLNRLDHCKAYNLHGSAWTGSGRPDIIGCYRGVMFVIELKRPGELPTKIQEYELCKWRQAGAVGWYSTKIEQVQELIDQIDQKMEKHN